MVIESKESVTDVPTATPRETIMVIESFDNVPVSSADIMGGPQGDQHTTMSSSTNLQEYRERSQLVNRTRVLETEAEVVSLRSELTRT